MSSDPGAAEIVRLMATPNLSLETAARRLAAELPDGVELRLTPARELQLVVDPALVEAIQQLRAYYRALRGRIAAVPTAEAALKRRVLDALDHVDGSLTLLVRSVDAGSYAAYNRLVAEAHARQAHIGKELRIALKGLA